MNSKPPIIITGFGLSGCLIARELLKKKLPSFSLVIIDREFKAENKHLCFVRNEVLPEGFIKKKWSKISMKSKYGKEFIKSLDKEFYQLLDWQKLHRETLKTCELDERVSLVRASVVDIQESKQEVEVFLSTSKSIKGSKLFNSVIFKRSKCELVQQFKGAVVEFEEALFDKDQANLMNFNKPTHAEELEFKYVLPFSSNNALVEYTTITSQKLNTAELNLRFDQLLSTLNGVKQIDKVESGLIPMPLNQSEVRNSSRVLHVGIAGGLNRRSSGYLLQNTLDNLGSMIEFAFKENKALLKIDKLKEFLDSVFLHVLKHKPELGSFLFISMFKTCSGDQFLRFMFNPSSFKTLLPIVRSLPKGLFFKYAALYLTGSFPKG